MHNIERCYHSIYYLGRILFKIVSHAHQSVFKIIHLDADTNYDVPYSICSKWQSIDLCSSLHNISVPTYHFVIEGLWCWSWLAILFLMIYVVIIYHSVAHVKRRSFNSKVRKKYYHNNIYYYREQVTIYSAYYIGNVIYIYMLNTYHIYII